MNSTARPTDLRNSARRPKLAFAAAVVAAAIAGYAAPAHAQVNFILTPSGSIAPEALAGFTEAAAIWSSHLTGNSTVRLTVGYTALGAGILGQAGSTTTSVSYTNLRNALNNTQTSTDDAAALTSLPVASSVSLYMNRTSSNPNGAGSATPWVDNNGNSNNTTISVNQSAARALSLTSSTTSDASITFSSNFTWDFNARDGVTGGTYDFVGVAVHEIGHALGFRSGVDSLDGSPNNADSAYRLTSLDLFRYSSDSRLQSSRDFTADNRTKYFSLDSGVTAIANFSNGVTFGDGNQASHWKDGLGIGILDPTFSSGEQGIISQNDLRALDVIGWNRNNTWGWGFSDGGLIGFALNWKTRSVPTAGQDALFDLNATYTGTVRMQVNAAVRDFLVRRDTFTFTSDVDIRTLSIGRNLIVADGAVGTSAALTITRGTYNIATSLRVGATGTGSFTLNGATVNVPSVLLGTTATGTGTFTLTSGTLATSSILRGDGVGGPLGTANFDFNGGTLTATSTTANLFANFSPTINTGIARINTAAFNVTINSALLHKPSLGATPDGGLTKTGTGILTLTGDNNYTGPTVISAGTLRYAQGTNNSRVTLRGPLTVAAGTKLDVLVNYVTIVGQAATVDTVRNLISTAFASGAWTGNGITSSVAAVDGLALGYANNADLGLAAFGGQSVTTTDLLIKYTWFGDADLNGQVDGDDYLLWLAVFGSNGTGIGWAQGDFDYDADVDGDDYLLWLQNFGNGIGNPLAAVPEPGTLALTTLAAGTLLARRRKSTAPTR